VISRTGIKYEPTYEQDKNGFWPAEGLLLERGEMAMRRRKERAAGILAATMVTCVTLAIAQVRRPVDRPGAVETVRDSRLIGAHVVRFINTLELDYRLAHGTFADWNELYQSGAIGAAERRSPDTTGLALGPGREVVPGWSLAIVVSRDGQSYQMSLRNVDDKQCRFSFFSDPSGLIYQGNVMACPGV